MSLTLFLLVNQFEALSIDFAHGRGDSRSQASLTYIFTQQIIYGRPTVPSTRQALRMLPWIKLTELLVWGVWHSSGEREFRWTSTICTRSCGYKFKGEELNREGEHSTEERGCSLKRLIRECCTEKLIIWTDSNLVNAPFLFLWYFLHLHFLSSVFVDTPPVSCWSCCFNPLHC